VDVTALAGGIFFVVASFSLAVLGTRERGNVKWQPRVVVSLFALLSLLAGVSALVDSARPNEPAPVFLVVLFLLVVLVLLVAQSLIWGHAMYVRFRKPKEHHE
jgi:uncharacterized membrane protein YfcA